MKLIDFDGLFDEKLAQYMEENAQKYTEKQWEAIIPKLYKKFGDTYIKAAGATPKEYYAAMSDGDLVASLKEHIERGVPVSDFLCREIEARRPTEMVQLLFSRNEQLLTLAVNLTGNNVAAFDAYFEILTGEFGEEIKEAVCEQLKAGADSAKERALALYHAGKEKELMLEILSRCKQKDDRVYDILLTEFRTASDEVPMHASYLAAYGDTRALPVLLEYIDRDEINYLEFQELKYAIEALGGEYTRPRDFSEDPYFLEIAEQSAIVPEFSDDRK